jgi:hypothetical protein
MALADFLAAAISGSNFACFLGYGDPSIVDERPARPSFDEIAKL